jgi:hypothetical protein
MYQAKLAYDNLRVRTKQNATVKRRKKSWQNSQLEKDASSKMTATLDIQKQTV